MAANGDAAMPKRPNFFIVGAPRCGTTAMYEYLRQHPEIFMPLRKEPHFFGSDLIITPKFFDYTQNMKEYLGLFAAAQNEKRLGEASPIYLVSRVAAAEIKEFSADAKIIIMLRNPVDMMHSLHAHVVYEGGENIDDFESALDAEEDRKRGLRIPKGNGLADSLFYRHVAKYSEQVGRYFQVFGRENVHIIIYDDLRDDTAGVYRETLRFLGVNPDFQPPLNVIYRNIRARSRVLRYLWGHRPVLLQRLLLGRGGTSLLPFSPSNILKRIYGRTEARPPLAIDLRRRLQWEFKGEVEQLGNLLGRDLTHWSER